MPIVLTMRKRSGKWSRPRAWLSGQWKTYECSRGNVVFRFTGKRWWGLTCYERVKGGKVLPLLVGFVSYEALSAMKKKKVGGGKDGPEHLAPMESVVFGQLFELVKHMATIKYEDGDPRKPGEVRVRPAGLMWVAEALDYDACCMVQCVQPTLDDALAGLQLLLEQENAPWQPCTWMKPPAVARKKK